MEATILVYGVLAACAEVLGGGLVILRKQWPRKIQEYLLGLSAGFILALVFLALLPESLAVVGKGAPLLSRRRKRRPTSWTCGTRTWRSASAACRERSSGRSCMPSTSHNSKYIYIDKFLLATKKMSFGLDGKPGDPQANLGVSEEAKHNIHAQTLWPEIEVEGRLREETANVGGAILAYYTELKRNLAKLSVAGWKVDLKTTSPDKNKRFSMTFVLVPAEGS